MREYFKKTFCLNTRSVLIGQLLIGLLCVWDLILKLNNLEFFTPERHFINERYYQFFYEANPLTISLFRISNSENFIIAFSMTGIIAAVGLILNKYRKISLVILWIVYSSFIHQLHLYPRGFEKLLMITFVWLFLIPVEGKTLKDSENFFSWAGVGWIFQLNVMYFFTFLLKLTDPVWSKYFTAFSIFLQKSNVATPFSPYLLPYPNLLKFLTACGLAIEAIAPVLVLIFFRKKKISAWICVLFILFHTINLTLLYTAFFGPICIAAWISLLPDFDKKTSEREVQFVFNWKRKRELASIVLIIFIFITNIYFFDIKKLAATPVSRLIRIMHLQQHWTMFANEGLSRPFDLTIKGIAHFQNSKTPPWDILNDSSPTDFVKVKVPNYLYNIYFSELMSSYVLKQSKVHTYFLAQYLCHQHPDVKTIDMNLVYKDLETKEVKSLLILTKTCGVN